MQRANLKEPIELDKLSPADVGVGATPNGRAPPPPEAPARKLYEEFADSIEQLIRQGRYRNGQRIPSVRQASRQYHVSITTVLHAYLLLESRGLLVSRPQSGYFVNAPGGSDGPPPGLESTRPAAVASPVNVSGLVLTTLQSMNGHAIALGSPDPDPGLFPSGKLNRYAYLAGRDAQLCGLTNSLPPGNPRLVRQIARRYIKTGMSIDPNEIVVTVGATEAINLCLQAVAAPGAVIAVESPTVYSMLHAIERMGMKAIEVPTDPEHGIDIARLESIMSAHPIAACMVMPNFQNPLGFQMPEARKRELVALMTKANVPIIENGMYNELHFDSVPPSTLKSYDMNGLVLHCSSFSASLTASFRIGWAMPGRYRNQVEKLKFQNTLLTPAISQVAIAEFLERDGYEHHLRRVRKTYMHQAKVMRALVLRFFPPGTRTSTPAGGYFLWIELPPKVNAMLLFRLALEQGITIGPGQMFSTSDIYRNFIRLNYSAPWSTEIEQAVIKVGRLASTCAR